MLLVDRSDELDDAVMFHRREPNIVLFANRAFHLGVCRSLSHHKCTRFGVVSVHDRKNNFLEFFESLHRRQLPELIERFRLSHYIKTFLSFLLLWLSKVLLRLFCDFVS